jgi:Flp pilus assembly protein TadG
MLKKPFSRSRKRTPAQAMVEFALVLPILLVVIYGLLEAGRLLFIYASVVTASRSAVRYGSATGINANGTPYYEDCDGITAAANSVAFITAFSTQITYDAGLDATNNYQPKPIDTNNWPTTTTCQQATASNLWSDNNYQFANDYRVNVQVTAQYTPIIAVENLIPSFKPLTITSQSSRSILVGVAIDVTSPPQGGGGGGGGGSSSDQTATAAAATATEIAAQTYTAAASITPSITPTFTITPSPTNTPTYTPTITGTRPTLTFTPTLTQTFTPTTTGTTTMTPTITPTAISCATVTHGPLIVTNGNPGTMYMTIQNPTFVALQSSSVYLNWNYLKGSPGGGLLNVVGASLSSSSWSGMMNSNGVIPGWTPDIPVGTSTITITFDARYANPSSVGVNEIQIILSGPNGCEGYAITGTS